jgi:hypothetical protein
MHTRGSFPRILGKIGQANFLQIMLPHPLCPDDLKNASFAIDEKKVSLLNN